MDQFDFTPTETRIMNILADGEPHPQTDLQKCLYDELGARSNIRMHILNIRRKLEREGKSVFIQFKKRKLCYRLGAFTTISE